MRKQFPRPANRSENAFRDDIISDTMNGIHSSKIGELWLLILKIKIAQREAAMTKMWKKCVLIQEESRSKTIDVYNILGLPNGTCRRILTEDLTLRRITTKFLPACLSTTRNKYDQKQHALFPWKREGRSKEHKLLSTAIKCHKMKIQTDERRFHDKAEIQAEWLAVGVTLGLGCRFLIALL